MNSTNDSPKPKIVKQQKICMKAKKFVDYDQKCLTDKLISDILKAR